MKKSQNEKQNKIKVVTICGSLKFQEEMVGVARELAMNKGYCVIQPVYGIDKNIALGSEIINVDKAHYKKIDISDAIFVVNEGGYIGESTKNEIAYAEQHGKEIMFLEK